MMRKLKITSFDQEGVRGGRSLEGVLSEIGNGESKEASADQNNDEGHILQICRLSFTTTEKASAMGRLILSRTWSKIVMEKTSGRFVSLVVQDAVSATRIFQVKQHQRYDGIKWNFGIDWFPSPLEEIHFTGVRFRGGDELQFLASLGEGLSSTLLTENSMGLKNLELNACRFLYPELQYPILFKGLRVACFGTLERLWMPKSPGLDDDRFQELFGDILGSSEDTCSLVELGFSYNNCGWKGSKTVCSFLQSPRSANLRVLYLNRQHGELDLEGILQSASTRTGKLQLNLSQNYVSSLEMLEQLRTISGGPTKDSSEKQTPNNTLSLDVQLDSMSFEVPEAVIPGNGSNENHRNGNTNELSKDATNRGTGCARQKSYEEHLQNLTQDDIAKLNVACGRVKYVLGRAAAACNRSNCPMVSSSLNPVHKNDDSDGSDRILSSLAPLDCVLPDLLTILRLQEKQNGEHSKENEDTSNHQQLRQYRNWLPTFLRKAIKGKIEILKPWLLSASKGQTLSHSNDSSVNIEGASPPVVLTDSEKERLTELWKEIEALHTNIALHAGKRRHKHSTEHNPGEIPTTLTKKKASRTKKHTRKGPAEIPMTPDANPIVKAAYEGIPAIPTRLLESSNGSFLSLPMQSSQAPELEPSESKQIRTAPPIFIYTVDGLELLRDDLFRKPPPHKIPKMVAVDSEWYFTDNEHESQQVHSRGGPKKRVKHRSMSVATLQIAYVDENEPPMVLRSFVIDLLSNQPGFQTLAKEFVFWLFGSASCDTMVLGFAFGGDLRQLRKYAGITGSNHRDDSTVASLEVVASRCLDIQHLLSSPDEIRNGRVPGLKKCAELFFAKSLKKDDQTSNWRERPLRPSQLEYAALDAVILLVLLSQKKQKDEEKAFDVASAAAM